ncbi:hypothetical protein L228DRAFT_264380 [Xylona heveae TC161]|uniref:mRNA export factor MEX67 n=1 Tax=Xylona heveae (strain CBS 132557 / TC161) TaxID=1328760 RepID=A0A165J9R0_XYLHT|nr:hypothetical protein L228DRAFT_264380 [Xylona heveae TC161]KZF25943.1 hypothetical protein L228DRAFT_264380 [Xylona heveae TC161]
MSQRRNAGSRNKGPARGGISKRRTGPVRLDRDGDLDMDVAGGKSGAGRGRGAEKTGNAGRDVLKSAPQRGPLSGAGLQKAILRGMATGDAKVRGPREVGVDGVLKEMTGGKARGRDKQDHRLDQVSVRGLKQSKAASNPDGGLKDLLAFLERKATGPDTPAREAVRIRKSRTEGEAVIVSVRPEDVPKLLRISSYTFAGVPLTIEKYNGPETSGTGAAAPTESPQVVDIKQKMTSVLSRRYDPALKLLNLSALGHDEELVSMGLFQSVSTESKFFPALMKVCDTFFSSAQQKREAVHSVSLANNELPNVMSVTTLSQTFPDIQNLDLSHNKFKDLRAMENWRRRFPFLDHLVLTDNPLETQEPNYKESILKWYPTLRILNGQQVRSDEEVAAIAQKRANAVRGVLPLPVQAADFRDEAQIGENFIKQFFLGFDTDRAALANGYYDAKSQFSLSVNTSAPRAPQQGQDIKSQTWDAYIKKSRNLSKISHLPARMARVYTGPESILSCWTSLPATRHANITAEPLKWLVECHSLPGLPDPSGQSPGGVGGLIVMVHGEFDELNVATGQTIMTRSFDRTFVLGPGAGIGGIRVISDVLVLRAYGGNTAWLPEGTAPAQTTSDGQAQPSALTPTAPQIPENFAVAVPGKSEEQLQQELMLAEMSKRTNMTLEYSRMCLEQTGWNFDSALAAYESAKEMLPPNAFMQGI